MRCEFIGACRCAVYACGSYYTGRSGGGTPLSRIANVRRKRTLLVRKGGSDDFLSCRLCVCARERERELLDESREVCRHVFAYMLLCVDGEKGVKALKEAGQKRGGKKKKR